MTKLVTALAARGHEVTASIWASAVGAS